MNDLFSRVKQALEAHSTIEAQKADKHFHKYEYRSYGIKTPLFREIIKGFKPEVIALSCKDAKELSLQFFAAGFEELGQTGIAILIWRLDCLSSRDYSYLDKALDHFSSWSMVDIFAVKVLQPLFFQYPEETFKLLTKWNSSKNLWKRRTSVVAFTRKIGMSGKFTKEGLALCEAIINDKEDLVRKGIGWALKDMIRGDKKRILAYIKELRKRGVSSTITLYALRDIKGKERDSILNPSR